MQLQIIDKIYTLKFTATAFLLLEKDNAEYRLDKAFINPREPRYTLIHNNAIIAENIYSHQITVL